MENFVIKESSLDNLDKIKYISEKTFTETFSDVNTDENMKNYLKENFSVYKLESEINNTA